MKKNIEGFVSCRRRSEDVRETKLEELEFVKTQEAFKEWIRLKEGKA